MNIADRILFVIFLLLGLCCMSAAGGGPGRVIPSEYGEALGAGGVRFDYGYDWTGQIPGVDLGSVTEVRDINNDGVDDLIFRKTFFDNNIQYALGEIRKDGSTGFTFYQFHFQLSFDAATAADLDGNGWPDLIMADEEEDWITIGWVEDGAVVNWTDEQFDDLFYESEFQNRYLDSGLTIRAGDLDGDGLADLVINTTNQKVVVRWSSREAGSAYSSYDASMLTGQNVLYPLMDYDGDADLDVLLLDQETEGFILIEGTGTDSVLAARLASVPAIGHVVEQDYPVFGHFDSDPAVDIVIYDRPSRQTLLIPNFTNGVTTPFALPLVGDERAECVPGDVDLSGFDELLVTGIDALSNGPELIEEKWLLFDPLSAGSHRVQIETGNTPRSIPFADYGARSVVCTALDLNGDSLMDLLWTGDISVHKFFAEFNEELEFGYTIRASPQREGLDGIPSFGASQFEGQKQPLHMFPRDFDADGIDELFMVGAQTKGRLVDVNDGEFVDVPGVNDAFMSVSADLGGDGLAEIVVVGILDRMVVKPVLVDGTFGPQIVYTNPNGGEYRGVVAADFDGDGKDDVIGIDYTNDEAHVYRGVGDAQMVLTQMIDLNAGSTVKPGVLDWDRDGFLDFVIGTTNGFDVYINQQDGTFAQGAYLQAPINSYWIIVEDMDLDGNLDLVSANYETLDLGSGISVHSLDASGMIDRSVYLHDLSGTTVSEVIAGDFTNDGLPDLVGSIRAAFGGDDSTNRHQVWAQSEGRTFQSIAVLPASESSTIAMSDLNLDGAMDVVTASDLDDSVRVHWGTPASCAADLTGDGALNFLDISEFLSSQLDFDGDGSFNFLDISAYLQAYGMGCP
tara:strand:+ start:140869 stop:143418 length:2550 start_codon:yes stop_codon:yes gene_type:complete